MAGTPVRAGPPARRRVLAAPAGIRVLIVGGVPGGLYKAPELGAPDPMGAQRG